VGQQLVLHVLMQVAVLGDEIIMKIDSPLHISIMHCNNYSVKLIWPEGCLRSRLARFTEPRTSVSGFCQSESPERLSTPA
jgi:hypothetical protein